MLRFSPRSNRAHLVKWREWGEAAFQEARDKDKLVAVCITAFWCGFCQRMDETTLSNDDVITLLNALFVPVRVDESQRPDVDVRYNQDGWPTIAFLTPEGDHLVSVNYMATEPFLDLLVRLVNYYQQEKMALQALQAKGAQARAAAPSVRSDAAAPAPLNAETVAQITGLVEGLADQEFGGYGNGAKFLHPEANEFLLYLFETTGERAFLDHVLLTLTRMRASRTYDAKDGGFFRYSSHRDWQEPHQEKLLGDQAALLRNYLHAYLLTDEQSYRDTAQELIQYLDTTLYDGAQRVFSGCQDYLRPEGFSFRASSGPPEMMSLIDTNIYCDANARVASAYLDAWWLLGLDDCKHRATEVLAWLWKNLRAPDGGMCHYSDGEPRVRGILTDSVMTGLALLDASALLHDETYLEQARELAEYIVRRHRNPHGGFFDISETGPARLQYPLTRLTQNAGAVTFFDRLTTLTGEAHYREQAHWALRSFTNAPEQYDVQAAGFGHALAQSLAPPLSLAIKGTPGDPAVRALARAARTKLGQQNLMVSFYESRGDRPATIEISSPGGQIGPIKDPEALRPELLTAFH